MIPTRKLTREGIAFFQGWLESGEGEFPSARLSSDEYSEECFDAQLDPSLTFASRYEFGRYLVEQLGDIPLSELTSEKSDGFWAWVSVVYFRQLAPGTPKKYPHYIVARVGGAGSLAYRHAARTSYELVRVHGENALVCLGGSMATWGEISEQLASRQTLALNRGFFEAAYRLYSENGQLKRGAASKPKKPKDRKPGDRSGLGGVRRLAIALQRLELTFDTEIMNAQSLISVLPKEFARWSA